MDITTQLRKIIDHVMETEEVDLETAKLRVQSHLANISTLPPGLIVQKNDMPGTVLMVDRIKYIVVQRKKLESTVEISLVSIGDVENALERIYQESMDVGLSWGPEFGELTDDSDAYDSEDSEYGFYLDRKQELTIYNDKNRSGEILRYGIDFWGFDMEDDKGFIKTQIMNYLDPTETHSCTWDEYECEGDWEDVVTLLKKKNKWNVFEDVLKEDGSTAELWQMLQAIGYVEVYNTSIKRNSKKRKR